MVKDGDTQGNGFAGGYRTLDEVKDADRTAVYIDFGESLVYHRGVLYVLPQIPDPLQLAEALAQPEVYELHSSVGVEFGWRYLECTSPRSDVNGSTQAA